MGVLSWLFPTPEDRIARGRAALLGKRFRDARDDVDGIDGPAAEEVRIAACNGLAALNLQHAVDWAESGSDERVEEHITLAEELHRGGLEELFRETRRKLRVIRESRRQEIQERQSAEARAARVDPLGLVGKGILGDSAGRGEIAMDDHEREARIALIVENYPPQLRDRAAALGPDFVEAVLAYEDGRPDLALQALLALPDSEAVIHLERSRCAWSLGDPQAAITALRRFAALANGHCRIGPDHTAVMLASWLAQGGQLDGSLSVLRDLRVNEPGVGGVLHAQVLHAMFRRGAANGNADVALLAEAEDVLREVITKVGKNADIYGLLAQIRLDGGHRVPAMHALELSLAACCDNPAKCGYRPADAETQRMLATLYLEDGIETARAVELAGKALGAAKDPGWDDLYLDALVSRATSHPEAREAAVEIWARTDAEDPRRERLNRFLPLG